MVNYVPQAAGLGADGSPDGALLQAMAARKKAQLQGLSGGQHLMQKASSSEPIYNKGLGYAKLIAGGLGGFLEGNEQRATQAKAQALATQGADSAVALAQSLGMSPQQAAQLRGIYLSNPEDGRTLVKQMMERTFAKPDAKYADVTLPNGALGQRNTATNELAVRQEPNKPQFGDTGATDPQTGQPIKGWIDPSNRTVTPAQPAAPAAAGPSVIPPVPPGVDPKVWREEQSKAATSNALPAAQDVVTGLRKEIQGLPSYKNISQAAPIYKAMSEAAGRDTKAADLNIVYGLGKIMDPTSVVREGEIEMANNTGGWNDKLNGFIKSIQGEGRLTPDVRRALMQEAYGRMSVYKQMYDQDAQQYRGIVERSRANPADVIPDFGEFAPFGAEGPPIPPEILQQQTQAAQPQAAAPAPAPATPPVEAPPPAQPVPGEDGWTDMGGGIRIRERR